MLEPEQRKSRELDLNLDSTGWGILEKFPASEHACHLSKVGVGEGKEYEEMAKPPFNHPSHLSSFQESSIGF